MPVIEKEPNPQTKSLLWIGAILSSSAMPLVAVAGILWGLNVPAPMVGPFSLWTVLCIVAAMDSVAGVVVSFRALKQYCDETGAPYGDEAKAFILSFPLPVLWVRKLLSRG